MWTTEHSLRHTFKDRLRAVETPLEALDQLGGWSSGIVLWKGLFFGALKEVFGYDCNTEAISIILI